MTVTDDYYEVNAQAFFDDTVGVDMSELYERFLLHVPSAGEILDAGCGSGRDALSFQKRGYEVTAFDASEALCKLASVALGKDVYCQRFDEITFHGEFDAVWACASLLHVERGSLMNAFRVLLKALKPAGVMYCSFKYGESDRVKDGRHFTDMTEVTLRTLLNELSGDLTLETWVSEDQRPDRNEQWLNALIFT